METINLKNQHISVKNRNFISELRVNRKKLNSFKKLESNWNFSNAEPFESNLLLNIENILAELHAQPKIFPTGRQSIQFEYEKNNGDYLEFEFFKNEINYLSIINEKEYEGKIDWNVGALNGLIDEFYA